MKETLKTLGYLVAVKKKKKKLWETNFVTNYLQQTSTSIVFLFSLGDLGRYGRLDLHSTS